MTDYSKGYPHLGKKNHRRKWDNKLLKKLAEVSGTNHVTIKHIVIDFLVGKPVMKGIVLERSRKQRKRFIEKREQVRHQKTCA